MEKSNHRTPEEQKKEFIEFSMDTILKYHSDTIDEFGVEHFLEHFMDQIYYEKLMSEETQAYFDLIDIESDELLGMIDSVVERYGSD